MSDSMNPKPIDPSPDVEISAPFAFEFKFPPTAPPSPAPSIEDLFSLLQVETEKHDEAEARIVDLRDRIVLWMQENNQQTTTSLTTGATARIDTVSTLKVADKKQLLAWAKSDDVGCLYLTEGIDTKGLADAVRRGMAVPGAELVTDERLVITPKKVK